MATFRIRDDVVYREIDGAIVAVSFVTGQYVALDAIGSVIWRWLEREGRVEALRARLLDAYDIDEATCDREVADFLRQLGEQKLITAETPC